MRRFLPAAMLALAVPAFASGEGGHEGGGGATCMTPCESECGPEGVTQCDETGQHVQSCLVFADGCTYWVETKDCGQNDEVCEETGGTAACVEACITDCDDDGATRCVDDGEVIQTCTVEPNGCIHWVDTADCADAGLLCNDSGGTGHSEF